MLQAGDKSVVLPEIYEPSKCRHIARFSADNLQDGTYS